MTPRPEVVITSVSSDAHTWNLVYLQLIVQELGCRVTNLGPCVPDEMVVAECAARRPQLIVVSSLNGHGCQDGIRLISAIRRCPVLLATPVVIGGKLDVGGGASPAVRLLAAGFDAVYGDDGQMAAFRSLVGVIASGSGVPVSVS
jgi:methylaspartate mutase sigma subunit